MKDKRKKAEESRMKPVMKGFELPESQQEWDSMVSKMSECGINQMRAITLIRERKSLFDQAVMDWSCQNE